jgi:hypothetical protein
MQAVRPRVNYEATLNKSRNGGRHLCDRDLCQPLKLEHFLSARRYYHAGNARAIFDPSEWLDETRTASAGRSPIERLSSALISCMAGQASAAEHHIEFEHKPGAIVRRVIPRAIAPQQTVPGQAPGALKSA